MVFDSGLERLFLPNGVQAPEVGNLLEFNRDGQFVRSLALTPDPEFIFAIALDPKTHRILVAAWDYLYVVNAAAMTLEQSIALNTNYNAVVPRAITWSPVDSRFYVLMHARRAEGAELPLLWSVDPSRTQNGMQYATPITLPAIFSGFGDISSDQLTPPLGMLLDQTTKRLYVAGARWGRSGQILAIDVDPLSAGYRQIIDTIDQRCADTVVDGWPDEGYEGRTIALNTRRGLLYCADDVSAQLSVIDVRPDSSTYKQVTATAPLFPFSGYDAYTVAVDPLRDRVHVSFGSLDAPYKYVTYDASTLETLSIYRLHTTGFDNWVLFASDIALDIASGRAYVLDTSGANGHPFLFIVDDDPPATETTTVDVGVAPVTVSTSQISITFSDVTATGVTTVTPVEPDSLNLSLPGQFSLPGALAYEISTTVGAVGPYTLCFNAAHVTDTQEFQSLVVLHGENGSWVDRTASRDFATKTICASVSSFSPFAVARRIVPKYQFRLLSAEDRLHKSGSTVPLKLQVLDSSNVNVSAASLTVNVTGLIRVSDQATGEFASPGSANPDANFRFDPLLDPSGPGYIFNFGTKGLTSGTYLLTFDGGGVPGQFTIRVK